MKDRAVRREDAGAVLGSWLIVGLLGFLAVTQSLWDNDERISAGSRVAAGALSLVCIASFLLLQDSLVRARRRSWVPTLVAVEIAGCLALIWLADVWSLLPLAIAAVLITVPFPRGVVAAVGVAVAGTLVVRFAGRSDTITVYPLLGVAFTTLVAAYVLYAITRLVLVLGELHRTRERLARVQVDEERFRISRDLHDILGRTLVAVSLRNQTALRLVGVDDGRARAQLEGMQATIVDGQSRLSVLTSGPTIVGLGHEFASARELFSRLGIRADIEPIEVDDERLDKALAAVVRESVTNMLKHSRPTSCRIAGRHESLATVVTIVNDGARESAVEGVATGHTGLLDVRSRIEAVGGVFTAEPISGNRFRVVARVPHTTVTTPTPAGEPRRVKA